MEREFAESLTVTEIGRWLETKPIPEENCRKFEGKHENLGCVIMTKGMAWYLHTWYRGYCFNSVGCFTDPSCIKWFRVCYSFFF